MTARPLIAGAVAAASLALAACGGSDLSTEDAHDTAERCRYLTRGDSFPGATPQTRAEAQANTGACLDDRQKRAIAFPNHFANVATSCDGYGHRIWTTTRDFIQIKPDPTCPGWTPQSALGWGAEPEESGR